MKKIITTTVVLMMIVAFPLLSWYYLKGGFEYRMATLTELEHKEDFTLNDDVIELNGKTTLITLNPDQNEVLLYDQFKDALTFQMITPSTKQTFEKSNESLITNEELINDIKPSYVNVNYLLVDDSSKVRMKYVANEYEIKDMVRHIATVLPIAERKVKKYVRE